MPRITLSGPNNEHVTRTVYLDDVAIGEVRPAPHRPDALDKTPLWEAVDLAGQSHGDRWLTDWYAAEALARAPRRAS